MSSAPQVGSLKSSLNDEGKTVWTVAGAGGAGGDIFENEFSGDVMNDENARGMWERSVALTGL